MEPDIWPISKVNSTILIYKKGLTYKPVSIFNTPRVKCFEISPRIYVNVRLKNVLLFTGFELTVTEEHGVRRSRPRQSRTNGSRWTWSRSTWLRRPKLRDVSGTDRGSNMRKLITSSTGGRDWTPGLDITTVLDKRSVNLISTINMCVCVWCINDLSNERLILSKFIMNVNQLRKLQSCVWHLFQLSRWRGVIISDYIKRGKVENLSKGRILFYTCLFGQFLIF